MELDAIGATGSQLPSLEAYLRSADFRVYREQTEPLLDYYRQRAVLAEVNGRGSVEEVAERIQEALG